MTNAYYLRPISSRDPPVQESQDQNVLTQIYVQFRSYVGRVPENLKVVPPLSFVSGALQVKEYGGNNTTLLHHVKSKAEWRLVHCFPNVASKRSNAHAMSSVYLLIGMRRRYTTGSLCLFRNCIRIELSLKEQHKVTISGSLILVFLLHTYAEDKMIDAPYKLPLPTTPHKTMTVHGTSCSTGGMC